MHEPRRWRAFSPMNWYLALAAVALGASLGVPWFTAQRTARVEARADALAEALIDVARAVPGALPAADLDNLVARFLWLASSRGVSVSDVERVVPPVSGAVLTLRNRHYMLMLAESRPEPDQKPSPDSLPAREVTAWPLTRLGPGHCVFFHPEDAPRAYSRNLMANFEGGDRVPEPGQNHRRPRNTGEGRFAYRTDERWILY